MKKKRFFTVGACMLGTLFALLFIFRDPPNPDPIAALPETKADDRQFMRAETAPDAMPVADETEPSPEPEMEPEPIHYTEDGMDPEDQPRDFYVQHFKPGDLPEGFVLNNVRLTDRGFELEPPKPGEEGQPRIGMVQSPPLKFTFESNGFAPMWKENLPEGTSVLVEVSVSPDGENWGAWHQADVDHDSYGQINEFYPDGTPNPNFGYTPGGNIISGNMTWGYFRYNIALYSETRDSPAISSFRGFYQDSTLGEGKLAELAVPSDDPTQ